MGEAKRRKASDPRFGQGWRQYLTDTYNFFRVDRQDGTTFLVTNLEVERLGGTEAADTLEEAIAHAALVQVGAIPGGKQCWIYIDKPDVQVGEVLFGRLSHHPRQTEKGFPTLHPGVSG